MCRPTAQDRLISSPSFIRNVRSVSVDPVRAAPELACGAYDFATSKGRATLSDLCGGPMNPFAEIGTRSVSISILKALVAQLGTSTLSCGGAEGRKFSLWA